MVYGAGSAPIAKTFRDSPAPPPRPSVIQDVMMTLDRRTDELHAIISELEDRLHRVLMPQTPEPASDRAKAETMPASASIPLAANIADVNLKLELAGLRLGSLIRRVEL